MITRDDLKWTISMIGAAAVAIVANIHEFPWLPEKWQHVIGIVAVVYATVAGKLATSPLPGKVDSISEGMRQAIADPTPPVSTPKDEPPSLPPAT